jgi:tetrahydromethanopterin S-methyltransferase subunit F
MRKYFQARRLGVAVMATRVLGSAIGVVALAAVLAAPGKWG